MEAQMPVQRMEAYTQVIEILKYMDKQYIEKIPLKVRKFFEDNCSKEYQFNIEPNVPLKEQNLKDTTLDILAMLNLNYWCEDEEHKKELIQIYSQNEKKYQQELLEKYNPENIFKNKAQEYKAIIGKTSIVERKEENIFIKILNKILSFLRKKQ